jgi:hypothetical protein
MNTTADPYVQLLSTTDPAAAHADFVNVGVNQTATGTAYPTQTPSFDKALKNSNPRPGTGSSQTSSGNAFLREKIPIIIVSSIGGGLVLLGVIVVCCTRDRFSKRGRYSIANTYRSYQRLGAPAPLAEISGVRGYHGGPTHFSS